MTDKQEGMEIEALGLELLDLGDATIETKQYGAYPVVYDSIFVLGDRFG